MSKLSINKKMFLLGAIATMSLASGCGEPVDSNDSNLVTTDVLEENNNDVDNCGDFHVHIYDGENILVFRECEGLTIEHDYNTGSHSQMIMITVRDAETKKEVFEYRGDLENCNRYYISGNSTKDYIHKLEEQPCYKVYKKTK